mmetsp:Transcript_9913/g.25587  ORF Transcript_9913/g.25587 Transcript_9913/m.25587 type:complete len:435 (-) Transcript_9913:311-1615(-)
MQRFARQAALAQRHTACLNRTLAAAPEAMGSLAGRLPVSPLTAVCSIGLARTTNGAGRAQGGNAELTLVVDRAQCSTQRTLEALQLPRQLSVVCMATSGTAILRGSSTAAPPPPSTKLHGGEMLTVRGPLHLLTGVCEMRAGRLVLLPPTARTRMRSLVLEHLSLLACAERLARRLQRACRRRMEVVRLVKAADAAMVLQIAWLSYKAKVLGAAQPAGMTVSRPRRANTTAHPLARGTARGSWSATAVQSGPITPSVAAPIACRCNRTAAANAPPSPPTEIARGGGWPSSNQHLVTQWSVVEQAREAPRSVAPLLATPESSWATPGSTPIATPHLPTGGSSEIHELHESSRTRADVEHPAPLESNSSLLFERQPYLRPSGGGASSTTVATKRKGAVPVTQKLGFQNHSLEQPSHLEMLRARVNGGTGASRRVWQ